MEEIKIKSFIKDGLPEDECVGDKDDRTHVYNTRDGDADVTVYRTAIQPGCGTEYGSLILEVCGPREERARVMGEFVTAIGQPRSEIDDISGIGYCDCAQWAFFNKPEHLS